MNLKKILRQQPSRFSILLFLVLICCLACSFLLYEAKSVPKIAYVRNLELVYGYNGMKQAHDQYKAQTDLWQANIDTLNQVYKQKLDLYKKNAETWSSKEKNDNMDELKRLEADIQKYTTVVRKQAEEKDIKITESILSQITSFVETYAKENGYDIILGAQGDGSVMYGEKYYDITEDVLHALNKEHKYLMMTPPDKESANAN